jgi:hypothetical protein
MKRTMIVSGLLAGGLLLGSGVALADTPPTSSGGDPVCTQRIPKALDRIDKLVVRVNGDASTTGSTAWLQDRASKARTSGHPALADLLDQRVADRPQKLQELQTLRTQLLDVQAKDCAK